VEVVDALALVGQTGQPVIVGRKQRQGVEFVVNELRGRLRDSQSVGRTRPAADLVKEDERVLGRVVENFGEFAHLPHERRLAASDVVARADAGENPVEKWECRGVGGHEAARLCE
jgi:hypothetical protein